MSKVTIQFERTFLVRAHETYQVEVDAADLTPNGKYLDFEGQARNDMYALATPDALMDTNYENLYEGEDDEVEVKPQTLAGATLVWSAFCYIQRNGFAGLQREGVIGFVSRYIPGTDEWEGDLRAAAMEAWNVTELGEWAKGDVFNYESVTFQKVAD